MAENANTLLDQINHAFWLKRLPDEEESNLPAIEMNLLRRLCRVVDNILQPLYLYGTCATINSWEEIQKKPTKLGVVLEDLSIDGSACVYVRKQNCSVYFTQLDYDHVRIITFRPSLSNDAITKTCGSLLVTYPETVDIVPRSELLLSELFSRQIDHLSRTPCDLAMSKAGKSGVIETDMKEPSSPCIVSDFLVTMLSPVESSTIANARTILEDIRFQKKLRDQVNWNSSILPFRRSGLWTTAKVFLSLSLNEEKENQEEAKVIYKLVILEVLLDIAKEYSQSSTMDWDVAAQILVKLARRAKKLSQLPDTENPEIESQREETLKSIHDTVKKINAKLSKQWHQTVVKGSFGSPVVPIRRTINEWEKDCVHVMDTLSAYLNNDHLQGNSSQLQDNLVLIDPIVEPSTVTLNQLLDRFYEVRLPATEQDAHLNCGNIWLHHVEWFVRNQLDTHLPCEKIFKLLQHFQMMFFSRFGKQQSDPVRYCRMIVTVFKIVCVLDKIAVHSYPMLLDYKTGITAKMFENLLIPDKGDMKLVEELQAYFTQRNSSAWKANWLGSSEPSENSFSCIFAERNQEMQDWKTKILADVEIRIALKKEELLRARKLCDSYQETLKKTPHSFRMNESRGRREHTNHCRACDVQRSYNRCLNSVIPYQCPLPKENAWQNAIVYELRIPLELAVLRDSVVVFLEDVLGCSLHHPVVESTSIKKTWTRLEGLAQYPTTGFQNVCHLGSDIGDSSYRPSGRNPPVSYDDDAFILENNLSCAYYRITPTTKVPPLPYTLEISSAKDKEKEMYGTLQFAMGTVPPSENMVIARQAECHPKLTLREFKAFGGLRCANRVQLRNLFAEIASRVLSLDKEPVVMLIMQTIWELGPAQRENHEDFEKEENHQFVVAFLETLSRICEENTSNWSNPLIFLTITIITVRILVINDSNHIKHLSAQLLKRCREILDTWSKKLEALVVKTTDKNEVNLLMETQLKCAIAMVLTFNVTADNDMYFVIQEPSDITYYLKGLARLQHLVVRESILSVAPVSTFIRNLLHHARVSVPLTLQTFLGNNLIRPNYNKSLHDFASEKWPGARDMEQIPSFDTCKLASKGHAYLATYGSHHVCINILRGTFFVDGYPPSVLPERIVRNQLFRTFFRTSQFRVQRDSETFRTVDKYRGQEFEFKLVGTQLIIKQLGEDGQYYELLPKDLLIGKIPQDLIENFTHWYDSKSKQVYFRHASTSDTEEKIEEDTQYLLKPVTTIDNSNSTSWHLVNYEGPAVAPTYRLLSMHSEGFRAVTKNLGRLESKQFIHVQYSKMDSQVTAKLWRFELAFTYNPEKGLMYCSNYPEFYVPTTNSGGQSLGTLVGLESGLVLEKESNSEITGKKKMFIVPHGEIQIQTRATHHKVGSSVTTPLSPVFFVYEVDQVLKRLKPGSSKSAWLFLALLHGSTSSPFPDPFTQLTGTEMAMWLLQSGFVWSCSPYDKECEKILSQIAKLSPHYFYNTKGKSTISTMWPPGLNCFAAYDGYIFAVSKLLEDSLRLEGLFRKPLATKEKPNLELSAKSYYRNVNMYNEAAHLSTEFMPTGYFNSKQFTLPLNDKTKTGDVAELALLVKYRTSRLPVRSHENVEQLIIKDELLQHETEDNFTMEFVTTWLRMSLRSNWMKLYSLAYAQSQGADLADQLTLIYGALYYSKSASLMQVLNLHNIEVSTGFPRPLKSLTDQPYSPNDRDYNKAEVVKMLRQYTKPEPDADEFNTNAEFQKELKSYKAQLGIQIESCATALQRFWPAEEIRYDNMQEAVSKESLLVWSMDLEDSINSRFQQWFNNRNLNQFIRQADNYLWATTRGSSLLAPPILNRAASYQVHSIEDSTDCWLNSENHFSGRSSPELEQNARNILSVGRLNHAPDEDFNQRRIKCQNLEIAFNRCLSEIVNGGSSIRDILLIAGIHQRLAPVILLRNHLASNKSVYVGALAVVWASLKRLNRLIMYSSDSSKYSVELERENDTQECENWDPIRCSEWLLLELELDITIRKIQVEVARQMMLMPCGKNGVMQLNMGEGKTSVIIPMIVATMTKLKKELCRVTVLNSIFATNCNLLGVTIGGLLNKRLYTIPCNRDINIGNYLKKIRNSYKTCLRLGGAVITLPEYRLSFRLQMYNSFLKGKAETGLKMYKTENWLRDNSRDLVDESDEIFSVKYQLIYTTGTQQKVDGAGLRWKVCQKLLELLPQVGGLLLEKYGVNCVEFSQKAAAKNPERFQLIRILSDECKQDFLEMMVEAVLDANLFGIILKENERRLVKEFLVDENITPDRHEDFNEFMNTMDLSTEKRQKLLLVSGYLRRGVLFIALKKRWRVEYGVKKTMGPGGGPAKLIAVPFRAKDVAAERTEFGHPDMAIVLTQLSYFYSGLSDEQLLECFALLENSFSAPEVVYGSWIQKIPSPEILSETVKTYRGINLQDYQQRKEFLFPILSHHTSVINFWLDNVAFPRECKQFPGKLVTNAFDLCYEANVHATTGFSGTNDTSLLLPVQITQQDLAVLSETNAKMEETLKRRENMWRRSLKMYDGCQTVISHMIKDGLRVLIDAGALMLEMGNAEIAQLWLDLDKKLEAVVYFNDDGEMVVKVRRIVGKRGDGKDTLLALSPYKDRLDTCAVYLDDQHTRGTDIKLPTKYKACVTVGSGMRRDKLIQACMRMRKLGKGQSVHFYLSHEVHSKITSKMDCQSTRSSRTFIISVSNILEWSKINSSQFEKDGLVFWATNARNYTKNLAADRIFELSEKGEESGKELASRCEDPDAQTIQVMYGTYHQKILVSEVVNHWFAAAVEKLKSVPTEQEIPQFVMQKLISMERLVYQKCVHHIPDKFYFMSILEEEQEKELEPEQEQEEEVHRPSMETPLEASLHVNVTQTVMEKTFVEICEGITQLFNIFRRTTVEQLVEIDATGEACFASKDFIKTIELYGGRDKMNEFLKTIRFVVSFGDDETSALLVLSQFEVNKLAPMIRAGRCAPGTRLHLFSARWMEGQPMLMNDPRLQLGDTDMRAAVSDRLMAPLLVAAGNLYFRSRDEETAFAKFLGLALKPWSEEVAEAFELGFISNKGFVPPHCPSLRDGCSFEVDPTELVMGILKMRNAALRECDHVVQVLDSCARVVRDDDY